jgi:hypothetical protein
LFTAIFIPAVKFERCRLLVDLRTAAEKQYQTHYSQLRAFAFSCMHSSCPEEYHLLGYNTVYSVECQLTFRKNEPAFTLVSCSAYFFDHEDGGDMFFRNIG